VIIVAAGSIPVCGGVTAGGKLLMALDCDGGDPNFRQLELLGRLAASIEGHPHRGLTSNDDPSCFVRRRP
jgi:hypothetical protein